VISNKLAEQGRHVFSSYFGRKRLRPEFLISRYTRVHPTANRISNIVSGILFEINRHERAVRSRTGS